MAEHLKQTIADLQDELAKQLAEADVTKQLINRLSARAGLPEPYPDAGEGEGVSVSIQPDTFYGQKLHSAIRTYLQMRKQMKRGPAAVNEIFEALVQGGIQFDTKNDANSKRAIRITLTKNSSVFHKLPNGSYGLLEWYPDVKKTKKSNDNGADDSGTEIEEDDDEIEEIE